MGIAADTYAELTRQQYDDWLARFYPKQQELLKKAESGEMAQEQLKRADVNLQSSMRGAVQANANHMARYGVENGGDDNLAARQALSSVSTKNAIRDHEKERSMSVLSGANMGLRDEMNVGGV